MQWDGLKHPWAPLPDASSTHRTGPTKPSTDSARRPWGLEGELPPGENHQPRCQPPAGWGHVCVESVWGKGVTVGDVGSISTPRWGSQSALQERTHHCQADRPPGGEAPFQALLAARRSRRQALTSTGLTTGLKPPQQQGPPRSLHSPLLSGAPEAPLCPRVLPTQAHRGPLPPHLFCGSLPTAPWEGLGDQLLFPWALTSGSPAPAWATLPPGDPVGSHFTRSPTATALQPQRPPTLGQLRSAPLGRKEAVA